MHDATISFRSYNRKKTVNKMAIYQYTGPSTRHACIGIWCGLRDGNEQVRKYSISEADNYNTIAFFIDAGICC